MLLPELSGKLVQLLTEMLPGLTEVAVLWNRLNPGAALQAEAAQTAARDVGLQVSALDVRSLDEIAEALATAAKGRVGAVIVVGDPLTVEHRTRIAQLAMQERLPVIFTGRKMRWWRRGGSWAMDRTSPSSFKRSAVFVDKIPQRRQAGGPAGGAAHEIRAGHQPQDRRGARAHDPPDAPFPGGRGDQVEARTGARRGAVNEGGGSRGGSTPPRLTGRSQPNQAVERTGHTTGFFPMRGCRWRVARRSPRAFGFHGKKQVGMRLTGGDTHAG